MEKTNYILTNKISGSKDIILYITQKLFG